MQTIFSGRVGDRWKFKYVNSHPNKWRDGEIIAIRDTRVMPVYNSRSNIFRSQFLVTMKLRDGSIKSFYADELMKNAIRIS